MYNQHMSHVSLLLDRVTIVPAVSNTAKQQTQKCMEETFGKNDCYRLKDDDKSISNSNNMSEANRIRNMHRVESIQQKEQQCR